MGGHNNIQESDVIAWDWDDNMDDVNNEDLLLLNADLNINTSSLRSDEKYAGFDNNAAENWIFPSNFPERAYQYNIVQKALFHNTLVVLPTGLGKTFIAAVVMYNIYRWYPLGKVIFMAPTRPLVAQQIEACCKIVGIPKSDSVEMTGKLNKTRRSQLWQSKRVFFATPQSVQSDILDAELNFPFESVKLIVVDEAHRAKGRYAYTEVVRYIWSKNKYFRILALSATPGRRKEDVDEVIRNLFISKLEVRTEESVDVVPYVHKRQLKVVVVALGTKLSQIRDELLQITDPHIRKLIDNGLISGRPSSISRNWLVMQHKRFRESTQNSGVKNQKEFNSDFNICISVYHAIELLERHGLRVFLNNFDESLDGGPKYVVVLRPDLRRLVQRVRDEAGQNPFEFSDQSMLDGKIAPIPPDVDFGHPKFEIAREHVLAHFESKKEGRVIIFCEYRESVMLMHRLLLQHRPLIRPRLFVGQGGTGSIRAVTQKQQMSVMNDFKSGKSNALIATSVAEEGIDVGEVDLIVCFDINTSNPTRFIQRIGRTGRQKDGKVLLLATEGKENSMLKGVLSERSKLNKSISRDGQFSSVFFKQAPRMVPTEFNPKCLKLFIQTPQSEEPTAKNKPAATATVNKVAKTSQKRNLTHFFKQKIILDEEDKSVFAESRIMPKTTPDAINNVNSAYNICDIIPSSPPPKIVDFNNKMIKKMAKYIRNANNYKAIETVKAVSSSKLSKESLQFVIDHSPDFLLDIWTRMQKLWQKGIDENNVPVKGIANDDRQIIRAYVQLENHFGSKETYAELIEQQFKYPKVLSYSSLTDKYKSIHGNLQHGGICQNNLDLVMKKCMEIPSQFQFEEFPTDSFLQSMVYEDETNQTTNLFDESRYIHSYDNVFDSKYMSQWEDVINKTKNTSLVSQNSVSSIELSTQNIQEEVKLTSTTHAATNKSDKDDDDVVFVGSTNQSTPIRTGLHRQLLLNFSETPIACYSSKRISRGILQTKNNTPNFMKTNDSIKAVSPKINSVQSATKIPEQQNENQMKFFDDQFDAIIAANSEIIEHIEKSNQLKANSDNNLKPAISSVHFVNKEKRSTNSPVRDKPKFQIDLMKTSSPLGSDDLITCDMNAFPDACKIKCANKATGICLKPLPNDISLSNQDQPTTEPILHNLEVVHPELVDIDINDFSDFSIDEIVDNGNTHSAVSNAIFNHRASPDIFDGLYEPFLENNPYEKSPIKLLSSTPPEKKSPCIVSKKILTWGEIRQKYIKPSSSKSTKEVAQSPKNDLKTKSDSITLAGKEVCPNESVISMPTKFRSKRRIIVSDDDSSDDCSLKQKTRKPQLFRRNSTKKSHLRKNVKNNFIDDEAAVSGSATEDEFEHTVGGYIQDSVVIDDEENESSIPMTGIYLQSVRSPCSNIRGAFKIPERRQYNDASHIFSQTLTEDTGSYVADSFVVISDDELDFDRSMCPLERAEQVLKIKKRAKRKAVRNLENQVTLQPPKKKRVLRIHNSSEDDSDFV